VSVGGVDVDVDSGCDDGEVKCVRVCGEVVGKHSSPTQGDLVPFRVVSDELWLRKQQRQQ